MAVIIATVSQKCGVQSQGHDAREGVTVPPKVGGYGGGYEGILSLFSILVLA